MKIAIGFVAVTAALMSTSASAAIITFAGLPGSNGSAFTGPYVEAGYSVSAMAGQVFEGHQFGNPSPSLVVGTVFGSISTGTIQVVKSGGGTFSFGGFDLIGQNGNAGYTVTGTLGASSVFSFSGSQGGTFTTLAGAAGTIDKLIFALNASGSSLNLDNINVSAAVAAVPESATWAMMVLGFGLVGAGMRARRTSVRFANLV